MIIGQFSDSFPPVVDGVANVCMNYAQELVKQGDRCVVVSPYFPGGEENAAYLFEHLCFKSFKLPRRNEYRWGIGALDVNFWKDAKDIPFDILHSHSPFFAHAVARTLSKRWDIPLVTTFHSKYRDDFMQALNSKPLVDSLIKSIVSEYDHADEVWTVNEASAETLREYGYRGEVYIMENGCDIAPSEPSPAILKEVRERFRLDDAPLFMYIGQHTVQKNMPMLLDALKQLAQKGARFNVLFLGDGALREEMQKTVAAGALSDRVVFAGTVRDRELVKKCYLSAAALLFPSLYDTSSLVPREAAACKCPTVLVRGSSTAQGVEDGVNGFLAGPTPGEYADKLFYILSNRDHRDQVAQAAFETLYRPWSAAVAKAKERYMMLIEKKKGEKKC